MKTVWARHRTAFKAIAIIVVCLFVHNNICWAYPADRTPQQETLQVQSMFNPLTDIKDKNIQAQMDVELRVVIALAKREMPFQDINSEFDEGYAGKRSRARERLLDVISNPVVSDDGKEVELELEMLYGPYEGAIFSIVADTESLEILKMNDRVLVRDERAGDEVPERDDAGKIEAGGEEKCEMTDDLERPFRGRFRNMLIVFITAATLILSSWLSRGAEAAGMGARINMEANADMNGSVVELELDEAGFTDLGAGVVMGNADFSPLGASPYVHVGFDGGVERDDLVGDTDVRLSAVSLNQRETENIGVNFSIFTGRAGVLEAGENADINFGWAIGSSQMWMDDGYAYYVNRPELAAGAGIDLFITPEDRPSFGASASAILASGDIRGKEFDEYELFSGENRLDLSYSTLRGRFPYEAGLSYRSTPLEDSFGINGDIMSRDGGISFGITAEQSDPKHGIIPERRRYGINLEKGFKNGARFAIGGYRDDLNGENVVTAGLRFDLGRERHTYSGGYGEDRFT